jgi:hypothetical protein
MSFSDKRRSLALLREAAILGKASEKLNEADAMLCQSNNLLRFHKQVTKPKFILCSLDA